MRTVWVPLDSGALALGADATVTAIEAAMRGVNLPLQVRRNGSRGMYWLEPMIEVETTQGRIAYGPVTPRDVPGLVAAEFWRGGPHPLRLGSTTALPYLASQERLTMARVGVIEPTNFSDYRAHGGGIGLYNALQQEPSTIIDAIIGSGLRGRGGAAFPTGIKWRTVAGQNAPQRFITCNADEGDSGTFADRMLMEGDPFMLIEGMVIAALAVGANRGYIYLRAEYPHAYRTLSRALDVARRESMLGQSIFGSQRSFDIEVRLGAGAYICGEETSMLESLEGRRGEVRVRPPLPAVKGLFGMPTVVNNVITLAAVPTILARGANYYRDFGRGESRGTIPLQLAGNVKRGGLIERAFGVTIDELVHGYGGGSATGRPVRAVQIGGPLGAYIPASQFDLPLDYEALAAAGALLGHGGVVVFDDSVDMSAMARYALEFCAIESCGKCTPCRIGSTRGVEIIDRIRAGDSAADNQRLLADLCDTMLAGSLCGLGGMTPYPVQSAIKHFPEDFRPRH